MAYIKCIRKEICIFCQESYIYLFHNNYDDCCSESCYLLSAKKREYANILINDLINQSKEK